MKVDLQMRIEQISKGKVPPGYKKIKSHIVPCEWDVFPIYEVCEVVSGGTPSTKKSEYWNGEIPWCTPTDITKSTKYISTTEKKITEEGLKNSSAVLLPKNSILMCSRATIGPRAINTVKMATNQGFKSFICNKTKLDYEFFYYLLEMYVPLFKKLGSGSTFLEISKKDVEETKIIIPVSIKEQRGIAEILSTWDKAIELKEKLIEQKKEQKKGLMQKLLLGEVRLPGFNGEWKKKRIGELISESKEVAKSPSLDKRITVKLNLKGVYKREVSAVEKEGATTQYVRKAGQFIYGKQNLHKGAFGLVPKELDGYQSSSDIPSFDFKKYVSGLWFYYYFSREHFYTNLERIATGTGSKRINPKDLFLIKILVPPYEEQEMIAQVLNCIDQEIILHEKELKCLKQQKKGLMQLLLTGKVRVKV